MQRIGVPEKFGEGFSQWFEWIIREAEIYDYGRYPVKGTGIWLPYGFKIRRHVLELIRSLLDETGHEEILLPLLIPETLFRKESEHVRGFEDEVLWITRGGYEELDVKLALRPTSETALSYMESFWIKSYKQLPKKYYQIVSVFRYETKMTKPMIRVREVTTFKEAHTLHEDFNDCERQVAEAIKIYSRFFDELAIPYLVTRRPQWDKFAGALYTIAFDTVFPDGKAVQIGTVHNLGQTFTSVFDVKIQKRDESIDYAWQTSYGISERVIATIVAFHSDERGLVLPPDIAPYQVVIIPIPHSNANVFKMINERCDSIADLLIKSGVRVHIDRREDMKPVEKFFEWELKGVPIRIEIGYKEIQNSTVTVFRRDTMKRKAVGVEELMQELKKDFDEVRRSIELRAWNWLKSNIRIVSKLHDALKIVRSEGGIVLLPWCGNELCVRRLIEGEEGIEALGELHRESLVRLDVKLASPEVECGFCGKRASTFMAIAKRH
ncbi:MAG: proline--tRNA ligase [Ignisphaera sp.]|nr:proline--tRNA ligase [Ignisphaera sp.]MCX8167908.1 proline--tRNA ligase [Ignisphaera sp.]MDW8085723.1 proline--tRNA ligase [Ignisphaera sp.]